MTQTDIAQELFIGGKQPVLLRRERSHQPTKPEFLDMTLLPGRGMNVFQARAWFPGLGEVNVLHSPSLDDAQAKLNGGPDDYMGVQSFSFGGAILLPFANRIRGRLLPDHCNIQTRMIDRTVLLPADWRGKHPGAEKCAMHGLILASRFDILEETETRVLAKLNADNFSGHWLSEARVRVEAMLHADAIEIIVATKNVGRDLLPVGVGWHPYFALPSEDREQVRLHVPARKRALVNNYDDVFPTGALQAVEGTPYDFTAPEGAPLGSRYFDDSFVDLQKTNAGHTVIEVRDPAAHYGVRLTALSQHVRAVQVYSPPDQPFVVVEPQFNWSDPFSSVWPAGTNTGIVVLLPGYEVTWAVRWQLLTI